MAEYLCRNKALYDCPILPYSPTSIQKCVGFTSQSNQVTYSPNSNTNSSMYSMKRSLIGRGERNGGGTTSSGILADAIRNPRNFKDTDLFGVRTNQPLQPVHNRNPPLSEDGFRSKSLEPISYNTFGRHRSTAAPLLTPNLIRSRPRQHPHVAFSTPEGDYETPEKIWQRIQRIAGTFRKSESARLLQQNNRHSSRSSSDDARVQICTDITPKTSPSVPEDLKAKTIKFCIGKRVAGFTAPIRPELRAPPFQRKRIRSLRIDDKEPQTDAGEINLATKATTLAEIMAERNGVHEILGSKMTAPSSLFQALKEVKHAEKEQLGLASQTEQRRITLFDLIIEKDRRHKAGSPPPIPPKPPRRHQSFTQRCSMNNIGSSVPKAVESLKPLNFPQTFPTPPSLPTPPKCVLLRKTYDAVTDASKSSAAVSKVIGDQTMLMETTIPISENPFVRLDRIGSQPFQKINKQTSNLPEKCVKDVRPEIESASVGSSGVGTENLDEDGPATVSASALSSSSVNTLNHSPSPEWPKPEKISARPQSHQCSPDLPDDRRVRRGRTRKSVTENIEAQDNKDNSPIRVSLIAAPKSNALVFDCNFLDAASDTSNSSRTSTIFSYPWDLPPPQSDPPSLSSTTSPFPLKWATLQHHLSLIEPNSPSLDSTLKPASKDTDTSTDDRFGNYNRKLAVFELSEVESKDGNVLQIENKHGDKASSDDELFFNISIDNAKILEDDSSSKVVSVNQVKQFQHEDGPYDMISDSAVADDWILDPVSSKEVSSPNLESSATSTMDFSKNQCPQQYVYAEVKPSSDNSASSSFAIHSPPVPTHPSNSKSMFPEFNPCEDVGNGREKIKSSESSSEIHSSESFSLLAGEILNPGNRRSKSRLSLGESGKHLKLFVCGLLSDKNSLFCKNVSTFIGCTIKQLGETPQKTLQNVRQFMDGVTRFLRNSHESELQRAIEAEEQELRGLQYLDVAQELEGLIQLTVLRPLHRRLVENLHHHGCGTILPRIAEEFANLVKKEYQNLEETERNQLEKQLISPVRRIFDQLKDTFQPGNKLEHLVELFQCIDSQVPINPTSKQTDDSLDTSKRMIYAVVYALAGLLNPTKHISAEMSNRINEVKNCSVSRIEAQRLYLEALISPACLASSAEGCRRLTDLVCLLRYVNDFRRYGSPVNLVRIICRHQKLSKGQNEDFWSSNLYKLRRSYTDNIQEALQRNNNAQPCFAFLTTFWRESIRNMNDRERLFKIPKPVSISGSSFIVLAVNESRKALIPFEIPLRASLTVRELCNMLALKTSVFDSKAFALFFHSSTFDIAMSDTLHLEPFLTQCLEGSCQATVDDSTPSVHSLESIDHVSGGASQSSTPKMPDLRRLFRRRKRSARSYVSLEHLESPKLSRHLCPMDSQMEVPRPSINWGSMSKRKPKFVFIYRRRSSEAVLFANDLFDCLPNSGKPI